MKTTEGCEIMQNISKVLDFHSAQLNQKINPKNMLTSYRSFLPLEL